MPACCKLRLQSNNIQVLLQRLLALARLIRGTEAPQISLNLNLTNHILLQFFGAEFGGFGCVCYFVLVFGVMEALLRKAREGQTHVKVVGEGVDALGV